MSSPESKSGFLGELFNNLMPLAAARGYPLLVLSVHTSNVAVVLALPRLKLHSVCNVVYIVVCNVLFFFEFQCVM